MARVPLEPVIKNAAFQVVILFLKSRRGMLGNQNKQNAENSFVWYDGIVERIVTLVITSVILQQFPRFPFNSAFYTLHAPSIPCSKSSLSPLKSPPPPAPLALSPTCSPSPHRIKVPTAEKPKLSMVLFPAWVGPQYSLYMTVMLPAVAPF